MEGGLLMDYSENDCMQKQPFFDDEALEREFSDPQLALDFDGEIAYYDEDVPQKQYNKDNSNGKPPKNKKGIVFLIIASVLLVCSAVFAVLMFIRMTNNSGGSEEETTAASTAALTQTTEQQTEQPTEQPSTVEPSGVVTKPDQEITNPQIEERNNRNVQHESIDSNSQTESTEDNSGDTQYDENVQNGEND